MPEGTYARIIVGYGDMAAGDLHAGMTDNVRVTSDAVTDLGGIVTGPITMEQGMAALGLKP